MKKTGRGVYRNFPETLSLSLFYLSPPDSFLQQQNLLVNMVVCVDTTEHKNISTNRPTGGEKTNTRKHHPSCRSNRFRSKPARAGRGDTLAGRVGGGVPPEHCVASSAKQMSLRDDGCFPGGGNRLWLVKGWLNKPQPNCNKILKMQMKKSKILK